MRGGHAKARRAWVGCSTASCTWIRMSPGAIAATVLCGRQVRQSRDGIVETTLETWEQRVAFTPGHAWTDPVRTCQSAAGSKRTGSKPADAECVCCTATKTPPAKA